jgi:alpha-glucosidase
MRRAKRTTICLCAATLAAAASGQNTGGTNVGADRQDIPTDTITVVSPGKRVRVDFGVMATEGKSSVACYSVTFGGKSLVSWSTLSLDLAPGGILGHDLRITAVKHSTRDETYHLIAGKTSTARDHCNEAIVSLEERTGHRRRLQVIFRAYDDGVAFRYRVPKQRSMDGFKLAAEHSTFRIAGNPTAYTLPVPNYTTTYEFRYRTVPTDSISTNSLLGLPVLFEHPDHTALAISEAELDDYAGMYLSGAADAPGTLTSLLSPLPGKPESKVLAALPHQTPWRILMIAESPALLLQSNLVTNLSSPCALKDTSWIKPGKTTFPWWNGYALDSTGTQGGLDTKTMRHYIDFCAEQGIEYHSLDGLDDVSWYGDKCGSYHGGDITKSLPAIDLPEVIRYARSKDVRLRLWLHWAGAKAHMKRAFPLYEKWGIEGVMVDFIERDDQEMVNFIRELVALAAKHHLTVTLHNICKPTGLERAYPNLLTYEGALNLEYNKWDPVGSTPDHEMMVAYIRMLAGPVDYHHGSFGHVTQEQFKCRNVAPVTIGTRARQIARYVVYEDFLPMMADYPEAYRDQPGLKLLVKMPTVWDETRVLQGEVGKHLTIARRKGSEWYVGSMTDGSARELTIPLSFLGRGKFVAEIYSDDSTHPDKPAALLARTEKVTAADTMKAKLAPAGGHIVHLRRAGP